MQTIKRQSNARKAARLPARAHPKLLGKPATKEDKVRTKTQETCVLLGRTHFKKRTSNKTTEQPKQPEKTGKTEQPISFSKTMLNYTAENLNLTTLFLFILLYLILYFL